MLTFHTVGFSLLSLLDSDTTETGMAGRDGVFGAAQALDDKVSLNTVVVQVPGTASVIGADRLKALANGMPDFRALLINYELFFAAQAQQTSACNAVHTVHTRMCKWLLRMHELVGADLPLTQEFLAQMMGVRRTSVSEVAIELQKAEMISYSRGHIHIIDIQRVRKNACECHETVGVTLRQNIRRWPRSPWYSAAVFTGQHHCAVVVLVIARPRTSHAA